MADYPYHRDEAEAALRRGDACLASDSSWADVDSYERMLYRNTCINEANVHATLALASVQAANGEIAANAFTAAMAEPQPVAAVPSGTEEASGSE